MTPEGTPENPIATLLISTLLPIVLETATLEIHEYMTAAASMTKEEVLAFVETQRERKKLVMSRLDALEAKIRAGG